MNVHGLDILRPVLDVLCPMHALLDATGHIRHAGPALHKLSPGAPLETRRFNEFVELRRPSVPATMVALRGLAGRKLHFCLRDTPRTELKGVLMPVPGGGAVVNLSFGISVVDAVRDFDLSSADFAATDLAVELLYLVEAKSAAMEASRRLNLRLQGARIAAEEQAFTDTLTGLKNRRAMDHVLARLIGSGQDFALMHLDLDRFKAVNDTLGHAAGDHVLLEVSRVMIAAVRADDTAVRAGGDEFVLILPGLTSRKRTTKLARRLIRRIERPIGFEGQECRISASIGVTFSDTYAAPDAAEMIDDADRALYEAKARGRGCHVLHAPKLRPTPGPEAGKSPAA